MKETALTVLLCLCLALTGCVPGIVGNIGSEISDFVMNNIDKNGWSDAKYKAEASESKSLDISNISGIRVNCELGDIRIEEGDSEDVTLSIKIEAKGETQERAQQLLEEYTYIFEESNGVVRLDTRMSDTLMDKRSEKGYVAVFAELKIPSDSADVDVEQNLGNLALSGLRGNFSIVSDLGSIEIKNCSGTYDIDASMGDVEMTSCSGSYDIMASMGNANLKKCSFTGNSSFVVSMGNIDIDASSIEDADSITASTNMGDVSVRVPSDAGYNASINKMSGNNQATNGNGKTDISISSSMGDASIN